MFSCVPLQFLPLMPTIPAIPEMYPQLSLCPALSLSLSYLPSSPSKHIEQPKLPWRLGELMLLALKKPFERRKKREANLQEALTILYVGVEVFVSRLHPTPLCDPTFARMIPCSLHRHNLVRANNPLCPKASFHRETFSACSVSFRLQRVILQPECKHFF